ncbi:adaptin N terminal region-domain-containing protein [Boeremia exigua]|uniref:adaptin N terminal region-domain-containing protein n=1 Tax=Boeremia exigua TaxID=749465 RepID=UPI001E8E58F0|nr:adaptin N terminal region-domain-containing protein [Boeremia exigua]KAH6613966.1 adaptin N terminal region-domain-containing protein [Boeremia exigua]
MQSISRISSLLETAPPAPPQPCKFALPLLAVLAPCPAVCRGLAARCPPRPRLGFTLPAAMHPSNFAHWSLSTARDLTLEAARDASNARKPPARPLPSAQLKKLLDSRAERDVLEGLRRVVTMSYRQPPSQTLPFFSHVIKNVASPSLPVKKLVYIYLLQHAEHEPDTALLSINTIQKSLTDQNPQLRALALRVMSGIRVPVISQIVSLAIKRGAADMSPHVRRAAALAIPKCYRLDPATEPQLLEYLSTLLADKQYLVTGAAVAAFLDICPARLDLIHPHYRALVRKLPDMDEWAQLATLQLMMVYSRKCFPRRTRKVKRAVPAVTTTSKPAKSTKGFYESESDDETEEDDDQDFEHVVVLDPDLELLLKSCLSLLQSRNAAVVIAVARTYLYLGTPDYVVLAVGPLVSLLRSAGDIQHVALYNIVQVCLTHPEPFVRYYTHFLVRSTDAPHVWRLKLELLTLIFPHAQPRLQSLILAELSHFSHSGSLDPALVKESVRAIGRCSQSPATSPQTSARCLRLLLKHIGSADVHLVAESLEVIRHLIQRNPDAHRTTVVRLAKHLDAATSPQARASIIWLVGEFAGLDPDNNIAADVLRILAKGFAEEAEPAKLQIMLLAAKVYIHHLHANPPPSPVKQEETLESTTTLLDMPEEEGGFRDEHLENPTPIEPQHKESPHQIEALYNYILALTRYDTSYDLRDRARVYRSLLSLPSSTQLASLLLLAPKPVPHIPSPSETRKNYVLGSASLVIGDEGGVGGLRGYEDLPPWVREGKEPDPSLRDETSSSNYVSAYEVAKNMSASERLDAAAQVDNERQRMPETIASYRSNGVGAAEKPAQKEKTLDDWLAESSGSEETDDDDEEDDDEGESEEESEYETESESGDENDRLVK